MFGLWKRKREEKYRKYLEKENIWCLKWKEKEYIWRMKIISLWRIRKIFGACVLAHSIILLTKIFTTVREPFKNYLADFAH